MDKYQYQPLVYSDSIRLVVLQPAASLEARIECFLIPTTLSACENDVVEIYSALSYVWGDATDTRSISVEGKDFEVTANLEAALRHMRDPQRHRRLWADAICIDQGNEDEKSKQVSQMGSVYKYAQNTIIYLGESTESSDRVLRSLRSPNAIYNDPINAQDLKTLLERPWFTRVWIYQELMFSREPWIQAGLQRIRWNQLRLGVRSPWDLHRMEIEPYQIFQTLATERDIFNQTSNYAVEDDFPKSLLRILDARRGLGVSDPRDMLFAHLGTLTEVNGSREALKNSLISIDYRKSVGEVYEDIVRYFIQVTGNYSVLSYVGAKLDNLPMASWAPNWSSKAPPHPYRRLRESLETILARFDKFTKIELERGHGNITELIMKECSSKLEQPWTSFPLWITISVLACAGISLGTVSQLSETITKEQASFSFRINDIIVTDTPVSYKEAARYVFEHWHSVLGPQMLNVYKPLGSEAPLFSSRSIIHLTDRSIRAASGDGIPQSVGMQGLQKIAAHLFLHATQRNNKYYPHFLQGRRFGVLGDGTPVLVPEWACIGDTVCMLLGDLTTPFILRQRESDDICDSDVLTDQIRKKMSVKPDTPVENYEFIGEGFADGWIFSDRAQWTLKYEGGQASKPRVFIMR